MYSFSMIKSQIFVIICLIVLKCEGEANIAGPLTQDFQNWLDANGYLPYDFVRADYGSQGSYGGKTASSSNVVNVPVVFIHGNSDAALRVSSSATGWSNSIEYFLDHGYTVAELYATSWQDTNALNAASRTHNCKDMIRLRKFVEAVIDYTAAPKISIISHSMGVTLARKLIKGGEIKAPDGTCNLGLPINRKVQVLVGISGANFGLCNCEGAGATLEKTCNRNDGLWPGDSCGLNYLTCGLNPLPWPCNSINYSTFLMQLNSDKSKEADYVFSAWSHADELIEYNNYVWGRPTSFIPTSDGKIEYSVYGHMQTKELTASDQYQMVKNHIIPNTD